MAKRLPGQSLKLLLEENRKWCHRLGADVLTLGSRQPLPTHKQRMLLDAGVRQQHLLVCNSERFLQHILYIGRLSLLPPTPLPC